MNVLVKTSDNKGSRKNFNKTTDKITNKFVLVEYEFLSLLYGIF